MAAIEGGADAVYFGALGFNARKNAQNFSADEMREAIALAHTFGVKTYVTLNTLFFDRERTDFLSAAESVLSAGADALIVADLGGAAEIGRHFPNAVLHASTQMSGHNVSAAKRLQSLGFSRMVCAREMSLDDLATFTKDSPIEAEVFVHGALCVCHSGQCLFSSVVGGRSGNRGECAQPCRLPYGGGYPLSLKDLALAEHIPMLKTIGVASLKIEGRMKSPEYVREVASIYRRLLDEDRGATREEMEALAAVFSRGGFTDGYFTKKIGRSMLGVRSESDKDASRSLTPFAGLTRKRPVELVATVKTDEPISLEVRCGGAVGRAIGQVPFLAQNAPLTHESVSKNLTKLGATPFSLASLTLTLDGGLMLPLSALNALRRDAVADLCENLTKIPEIERIDAEPLAPQNEKKRFRSAYFRKPSQIPEGAQEFFDVIYLPLDVYDGSCAGVALPPVIFDGERARVEEMLRKAVAKGARHALLGNLGHLELAECFALVPHGDLRLNIANRASAAVAESLGFADYILSSELSLPKIRDIGGASAVVIYGRLPLMILEKCVGKELGGCKVCESGEATLVDRRGISFPVLREWEHRSLICNSLPTGLSDRGEELRAAGVMGEHFLFTTETKDECAAVIEAYKNRKPLPFAVRRLPK